MRPLLLLLLGARASAATFAIEVSVVDESGAPLPGAAVFADAAPRLSRDPWNAPARRVRVEATADSRGTARLGGEHALAELGVGAAAPGFHPAARQVALSAPRACLVLPRRMGIAESVRYESLTRVLPDDGAEHGFDLLMGAFTAPLGVGRHADVWLLGRCAPAGQARGAAAGIVDEVEMRFACAGDGVVAVPRPGQPGFAAAISPACSEMILPDLSFPRRAPAAGYVGRLASRSGPGVAPLGRANAPQWVFRVTREGRAVHGMLLDFGRVEDGRLRIACRVALASDDPSLEFGP